MREFPKIDKQAKAAALQTVFFTDGELEGRPYRASRANYLAFLSLRGSEVAGEIEKLRALFAEHSVALLEQDVICLLTARNWRFHNIASVVLAAGFVTDRSLASLWECIHSGSWTAPQLVATAAYVDSGYEQKARQLLTDHATYFKSIVPLAEVLLADRGWTTLEDAVALANLQEARAIDRDNSGAISLGWLANLRGAFGPSFVRRS